MCIRISSRSLGNTVGSRFEYDSLTVKTKTNETELMSVDVKTTGPNGIIFYAHQVGGTDMMAVYLKDGKV